MDQSDYTPHQIRKQVKAVQKSKLTFNNEAILLISRYTGIYTIFLCTIINDYVLSRKRKVANDADVLIGVGHSGFPFKVERIEEQYNQYQHYHSVARDKKSGKRGANQEEPDPMALEISSLPLSKTALRKMVSLCPMSVGISSCLEILSFASACIISVLVQSSESYASRLQALNTLTHREVYQAVEGSHSLWFMHNTICVDMLSVLDTAHVEALSKQVQRPETSAEKLRKLEESHPKITSFFQKTDKVSA